MQMITLYRAMNKQELDATLNSGWLQFNRNKEKCFTEDLSFITNRVKDGNFNNSKFIKGRYEHILKFKFNIEDSDKFIFCRREVKTYSRLNPKPVSIELVEV